MGCQSVTGKGLGSAERTAKGCKERGFVGVEKLIGPRVTLAMNVTLTGATTVVYLPTLLKATDYGFIATGPHAVTVAPHATTTDRDGNTVASSYDYVTVGGTQGDVVTLVAVRIGDQAVVATGAAT